ncbi:MAG: cupin domain-containing protein [Spirochaetales bacterium]|uniref:Cupin domain-containing protein n=1 Tax=Candidatus Thalassospirochaeta sargassi TaxID=3119039 RepID=A0AAJ1IIN3_9SPIO|nr:cupin domain-containing protein [Spirochaetales bacterium]
MINSHNEANFIEVIDGVEVKSTVYGEKSIMSKFRMRSGHKLPSHNHPDYEQTGYLLEGYIVLSIGGTATEMRPGDSWCIGCGVEHSAEIIEDSVALEVFTYPREDYVKLLDPESR